MLNVQIDGVVASIPERHAHDRGVRASRQLRAALLLSPEAHLAGQLPDVPDRIGHAAMGPGSQTGAGSRRQAESSTGCRVRRSAARSDVAEGMGIRTNSPLVEECRQRRDGISAHQSSARLPDLRPGGRMPAAGIQRRIRQRGDRAFSKTR